jgi:thiamine biosynthesis lipoprotein
MVMGLPFSVHIRGTYRPDAESAAVQRIWRDLREADRIFSTFRPDSDISRLARGELSVDDAHPWVKQVLAVADLARRRTGGSFDVRYSGTLDPAGIVKAWAARFAAKHLEDVGADWYLGAGGDILLRSSPSSPPWRVGIEDPFDPAGLLTVIELGNGAVATSGRAHRGVHIISPASGHAPTTLAQATVCGPDLLWADVYATAWIAADSVTPGWSMAPGYECLLVMESGQTLCSPGLCDMLAMPESGGRSRTSDRPGPTPSSRSDTGVSTR